MGPLNGVLFLLKGVKNKFYSQKSFDNVVVKRLHGRRNLILLLQIP